MKRLAAGNPALRWHSALDPAAPRPGTDARQLRFRVQPSATIVGDDLVLRGELENPTDQAVAAIVASPELHIGPVYENGIAWQRACPEPWCDPQPPVRPPSRVVTVPARTVVEFVARHDLRTVKYAGSPVARFAWYSGLHGDDSQRGVVEIQLPPRP